MTGIQLAGPPVTRAGSARRSDEYALGRFSPMLGGRVRCRACGSGGPRYGRLSNSPTTRLVRSSTMKVGIQIPSFTWPGGPAAIGPTLARIVRQADDVGFDSIWVMDHFFQIRSVGRVEEPMLEGWTTLGYIAAHSQRARLGLMVGGVHYRHPGLWVKAATTLDVLSGGRAWLGIGAAWNEEESRALGFPFPPLGERFELLEETLRIAHGMWEGERGC